MNKTSTIWIIAALCVTVVLTAFGVITHRMVQKNTQHSQQIVDAHREGRIRLAMWRLDTLAASIIADEDERSVLEFTNPELNNSNTQNTPIVNGFYYKTPDTANLYWNIEPNKSQPINSPQVYGKKYLINNKINTKNNDKNLQQLNQLKTLLQATTQPPALTQNHQYSNQAIMCAAADVSLGNWAANKQEQKKTQDKQDFSYNSYSQTSKNKQAINVKLNAPAEQRKLTRADKGVRKKALSRISGVKNNTKWSASLEQSQQEATPSLKQLNQAPAQPFSTPFSPIWLDDELMLVRKASLANNESVQGIWLNKQSLIKKLLSEIQDLFPNAKLIPVKQDIASILQGKKNKGDDTTLLSIPLRLIHNDLALIKAQPVDIIRGPIGLAWIGAILAIIASYFTLKSVLTMAERRASFVSSVTHELRTPLTTFRLYSDLLSSGMVKDTEKQQIYLNTLKHESERLSHLIDNVLSYSQIERGSAKAKIETISLYQFIQRIEPRLNERAKDDNMFVNTVFSDSSSDQKLYIDVTAVEQIIFNLVDNACKYASAQEHGREITLLAEVKNKKVSIQICDQGNGIARSEQKRLFKPFHKSAFEAAHTKPGVGLGLALCKRLAKAMKGDLTIAKQNKTKGACFLLRLPINH